MAKTEQILRIKFIEILLKERKAKGASYTEIEDYLEEKFADKDLGEDLKFSKKTFERDKKAIAEIEKRNLGKGKTNLRINSQVDFIL